jgi:transcriptional regulator with XRE-family HTH domain
VPRRPSRAPEGVFAERLDFLLRNTINPRTRRPWTYREVADEINTAAGQEVISAAYVGYLRTGERKNPTLAHLMALAGFFKVHPVYFLDCDEGAELHADAQASAAWRDEDLRATTLAAAGLSPHALKALRQMAETLRAGEGLAAE